MGALTAELRAVNEEHVGEPVLEALAYYALTGETVDLAGRLRSWVERYCHLRAARGPDPSVGSDPIRLFDKLWRECGKLLDPLWSQWDSVHRVFVERSEEYAAWLLYTLLWEKYVREEDGVVYLDDAPSEPGLIASAAHLLTEKPWRRNRLAPFLQSLVAAVNPAELAPLVRATEAELVGRLADLAADVQSMRPVLRRNFHPHRAVVEIGPDRVAGWNWAPSIGIAQLTIAPTAELVTHRAEGFRTSEPIAVGYGGRLCDYRMPWLTSGEVTGIARREALAANVWLLERFAASVRPLGSSPFSIRESVAAEMPSSLASSRTPNSSAAQCLRNSFPIFIGDRLARLQQDCNRRRGLKWGRLNCSF